MGRSPTREPARVTLQQDLLEERINVCGVAAAPSQLRRRQFVEGCVTSSTSQVLPSKHRSGRSRQGVAPGGWPERHANRPRTASQRDFA